MKEMVQEFAETSPYQGILGRLDYHRLKGFGEKCGQAGIFSNVLCVTSAKGMIMAIERQPGDKTEYECFRKSWLYNIIGSDKTPADGYQVPIIRCNKKKDCAYPTDFSAALLCDGQLDLGCEMAKRSGYEPHVMPPIVKVTDGYRDLISVRGNFYNKAHDNFRIPIEGVLHRFFNKFKILHTNDVFTYTMDKNLYNSILEALAMIFNINVEDGQDIGGDAAAADEAVVDGARPQPAGDIHFADGLSRRLGNPQNHIAYCDISILDCPQWPVWYPNRILDLHRMIGSHADIALEGVQPVIDVQRQPNVADADMKIRHLLEDNQRLSDELRDRTQRMRMN